MSSAPPLAEPITLSSLLDQSMRLLRRHLKTLVLPFAVPLALAGAAIPVAQIALTLGEGETPGAGAFAITMGLTFVAILLFFLVYLAMQVAAVRLVVGGDASGAAAWRAMLDLRLLGTVILMTLVWMIGFLFCVVPGIYLALLFTAVVPVMVNEGVFGPTAMKRSATLMRYNPEHKLGADPRARSFVLWVTGAIIGYALGIVVQLPLMAAMMVMVFRQTASGAESDPQAFTSRVLWMQVPSNAVGNFLQAFVYFYIAIGLALVYLDVVRRKEGGDLLAASESLGVGPGTGGA